MFDKSTDNLYCTEVDSECNADTSRRFSGTPSSSSPSLTVDSQHSDELTNLTRLINSESDHMPNSDYNDLYRNCNRNRSVIFTARRDSVNWILKVHEFYKFKPATAMLSVNYFDRFLSTHHLPLEENYWSFQLLSVACLSLAAKMEELEVPSLLDLQLFEPAFVFESKTVQRMEILVMENLNWRLCSITPFNFIDYFISSFPCSSPPISKQRIFSVASDLILSTTRVIDFIGLLPSAIAAAAVISSAGDVCELPVSFYKGQNSGMVKSCHQLMNQYLSDTCQSSQLKNLQSFPTASFSPSGILDAAAAATNYCDTETSSQAEQPCKRLRYSTQL